MEYPQYKPELDQPPLDDDEIDALDELLRAVPSDAAMNIEALDGYLTGLLVGPRLVGRLRTADWLPAAWGGDGAEGAPFASGRQRKRATVLVLRHLHQLDRQLHHDLALWEPVVSVADHEGAEIVDAQDWCAGFLQAVALAPADWEPLFDDPVLGPVLEPIALLGGDESQMSPEQAQRLDDPQQHDDLSRAALDAVALLVEHARPLPADE